MRSWSREQQINLLQRAASREGFQAYYRQRPAAFVTDCLSWAAGEGPTPYQVEILEALPSKRRASVRGPHGLGKSALAAWVILWFALTRDGATDWKVVTTASAWRQLTHFLWPEIRKWARRLQWGKIGRPALDERSELLQLTLKLDSGEAFAAASDRPELIEGAHADSLLYVFDESKAIPADTFDAAEGAFAGAGADTTAEALALAISTPGEPNGRFYDIQSRRPGYEDWWTRRVTLEECIAAGRVSEEWAAQRAAQWGVGSAVYQNRVLGEFAAADADGVIPLTWVEAAVERWHEWVAAGRPGELTCVGVDVAREGDDATVLAPRYGKAIGELRSFTRGDTMETTGQVCRVLGERLAPAVVDVIGVGAGVFDRLREMRREAVPFNAAEAAKDSNGRPFRDRSGEWTFTNKRSAAWWGLRELLDPANQEGIALPPDDGLIGDLTAPHYRVVSGGSLQVEAKAEIKKRLGRSTDRGDAVMQAFWLEREAPGGQVLFFV